MVHVRFTLYYLCFAVVYRRVVVTLVALSTSRSFPSTNVLDYTTHSVLSTFSVVYVSQFIHSGS